MTEVEFVLNATVCPTCGAHPPNPCHIYAAHAPIVHTTRYNIYLRAVGKTPWPSPKFVWLGAWNKTIGVQPTSHIDKTLKLYTLAERSAVYEAPIPNDV